CTLPSLFSAAISFHFSAIIPTGSLGWFPCAMLIRYTSSSADLFEQPTNAIKQHTIIKIHFLLFGITTSPSITFKFILFNLFVKQIKFIGIAYIYDKQISCSI